MPAKYMWNQLFIWVAVVLSVLAPVAAALGLAAAAAGAETAADIAFTLFMVCIGFELVVDLWHGCSRS